MKPIEASGRDRPRLGAVLSSAAAGLLVTALAAGGCSTPRAVASWIGSPLLQFAGAGSQAGDCDEQPLHVAPAASKERLRIGSWNLHYLGPSEKTPHETRDVRAIASYVRSSGVSVLALQEIGISAESDSPRSPTLDAIFDELRADGADWTYRLFCTPEGLTQCTGLAWDRRVVTETADPMELDVDTTPPGILPGLSFLTAAIEPDLWMRRPVAVKLSAGTGRTDLVFISVHLKSHIETFFFEDSAAHREAEALRLVACLDDVAGVLGDRDVVVLGDFNVGLATESVGASFTERGWRDLNCARLTTHEYGFALDRIFVPSGEPEFGLVPNFATVVPAGVESWDEFVERFSDHLLVVADVLITRDDD